MQRDAKATLPSLSPAHFLRAILFLALLLCMYWLFVGNAAPGWSEGIVGLAAALCALSAAWCVQWQTRTICWPRLAWLVRLRHLPVEVVTDTVRIFGVLSARLREMMGTKSDQLTQVSGLTYRIAFDAGDDDSAAAARRALVVYAVCIAPNTYAITFHALKGWMLIHQLKKTGKPPGSGDPKWPV